MAGCAVLPSGASAAVIGSDDPFCTGEVLVDYEGPLRGLPAVRELPRSGRLPFGPTRLAVRSVVGWDIKLAEGSLAVEGQPVRHNLRLTGWEAGSKYLGWEIESRLVEVDRKGRDIGLAKRRVDWIRRIHTRVPRAVGFGRSPEAGLYRYDLIFRNRAGGVLGHFHRHYVIAVADGEVELALKSNVVRPGDEVLAQMRNHGPHRLHHGVGFRIDRNEGGVWAPIDNEAVFGYKLGFILIGLILPPLTSERCASHFEVPDGMTPGLYRVVKHVNVYEEPGGERSQVAVEAEFTVLPPA